MRWTAARDDKGSKDPKVKCLLCHWKTAPEDDGDCVASLPRDSGDNEAPAIAPLVTATSASDTATQDIGLGGLRIWRLSMDAEG
jgi:hypothetical protein